MQRKFHESQAAVFDMMRDMPRELLLVLRNQNYVRYLDRELGRCVGCATARCPPSPLGRSPVNRYVTTARVAVRGLSFRPSPPLPLDNVDAALIADLAAARPTGLGAVRRRVWFEVCLGFFALVRRRSRVGRETQAPCAASTTGAWRRASKSCVALVSPNAQRRSSSFMTTAWNRNEANSQTQNKWMTFNWRILNRSRRCRQQRRRR